MLTNKSTLIMARLQAMQCRRKLTRKGSCLNALLWAGCSCSAAVLQGGERRADCRRSL